MPRGRGAARGGAATIDLWPGFVDALSSLLLVLIFLLMVYALTQLTQSWTLTRKAVLEIALREQLESLEGETAAALAEKAQVEEALRALERRPEAGDQPVLTVAPTPLARISVMEAAVAAARQDRDAQAARARQAEREVATLRAEIIQLRDDVERGRTNRFIGSMSLHARYEAALASNDPGEITAVASLYRNSSSSMGDQRAAALLSRAVELGDGQAMLRLGQMYATGDGVRRNTDRARQLFEGAQSRGVPTAAAELRRLEAAP